MWKSKHNGHFFWERASKAVSWETTKERYVCEFIRIQDFWYIHEICPLRRKKGSHCLPLENLVHESKFARVRIFFHPKKCEYFSVFPCAGKGQLLLFRLTLMRPMRVAIQGRSPGVLIDTLCNIYRCLPGWKIKVFVNSSAATHSAVQELRGHCRHQKPASYLKRQGTVCSRCLKGSGGQFY